MEKSAMDVPFELEYRSPAARMLYRMQMVRYREACLRKWRATFAQTAKSESLHVDRYLTPAAVEDAHRLHVVMGMACQQFWKN